MTTKLSGPMVPPKAGGAPKQAVVLLHGYGSDGQDLIGLAGYWRERLPEALFVAPNGPERCRDNPGGYQWFPIERERAEYRTDGAEGARPVIAGFLGDLWSQTGLAAGQTLLAGFSQGAMMALNVGLALDAPPMGILAFSGALIVPAGFAAAKGDARPRPPICLVHGDMDGVVDPEQSRAAAAFLSERGFDVRLHIERGAGHTIAQDGLEFASDFIAECAGRG